MTRCFIHRGRRSPGSRPNGEGSDPTRTARQFAECNFNVKRTARRLDVHTHTVYFRRNCFRDLTGINPRSYAGLSLLLTTVRMMGVGMGRTAVGR